MAEAATHPAVPVPDARSWWAVTPPLPAWTLDFAASSGFGRMTAVQAATLPQLLGHKDVVVEAVTGSGKTLAFLVPLVLRLLRLLASEPRPRLRVGSVVVAPTRELATQIFAVLQALLAFHPASSAASVLAATDAADLESRRDCSADPCVVPQLLVGGSSSATPADDLAAFLHASPNVLVGTPGRLAELLTSPRCHGCCSNAASFDLLVLDEADRLLDLGFQPALQRILAALPKQRRTALFSASVGDAALAELVRVGLRNPVRITVRVAASHHLHQSPHEQQLQQLQKPQQPVDGRTPPGLRMTYLVVPASHKLPALVRLLRERRPRRTVVFAAACAAVDYLQRVLLPAALCGLDAAVEVVALHGRQSAAARRRHLSRFNALVAAHPVLLLTTDLAARGLDLPLVDLVVQLDPPADPRTFLHRCGRTARAGRRGLAVLMLHPGPEEAYVSFLAARGTPVTPLTPSSDPLDPPSSSDPDHNYTVDPDLDAAAGAIATAARAGVRADRGLYDQAQRGFVSWVRAYTAHQAAAAAIFRTASLDWADLARAWALLRLPVMPELRAWDGDRDLGLVVDWTALAYRDPARERARLLAAAVPPPLNPLPRKTAGLTTVAWSASVARDADRSSRRDRRRRHRDANRASAMTADERTRRDELDQLLKIVRQQNASKEASSS